MKIIIGSVPPLKKQSQRPPQEENGTIAGRLLHVRPPRKGIAGPSGMERRMKQVNDPRTGRVLTIMVPDGSQLPPDLETADYDVSIRFVRR